MLLRPSSSAELFKFRQPLAAAGLTIIMIGATTVSVLAMGAAAAIVPAIVGVATVWIAYGRTSVAPIVDAPRRVLRAA